MQRQEAPVRPSVAETGDSHFRLAEDAQLLMKSSDSFLEQGSTELPNPNDRAKSSSTWLFDLATFGENRKLRRKCNALFPRRNRFLANLLLGICYFLIVCFSSFTFVAPVVPCNEEREDWCPVAGDWNRTDSPCENPDYKTDPCRYERLPVLLFFTLEECDVCQRLLVSAMLGGCIGHERRSADRPAGIRTVGLVSLGACFFTILSMLAFKSSTQTWDASRVTAALPSGVGFLGGALIWKGTAFVEEQEMHQVHGLTTAASLWLSAAVGVGVGGALHLTILVITTLRYGPKGHLTEDCDEGGASQDDPAGVDEFADANDADANDMSSNFSEGQANAAFVQSLRAQSHHSSVARCRKTAANVPTFHG